MTDEERIKVLNCLIGYGYYPGYEEMDELVEEGLVERTDKDQPLNGQPTLAGWSLYLGVTLE